jgi:spermidine/putrescine transport system permease protein
MKKQLAAIPYIGWMIVFIALPLLLILGYSITTVTDHGLIHFTFNHIRQVFNPIFLRVIGFSFWIALQSTFWCFIIGYPIAYILAGNTFKNKGILLFLLLAPMWMNFLLRTYSWLTLLERNGIINSLLSFFGLPTIQIINTPVAVMIGMVYNFLPFMILPIYLAISKIESSIIEAAHDLGAGRWNVFKRVIFPMSLPGVFSGILMVFMPAVTTFVIPQLLGGSNILIGNIIQIQFTDAGNWALGSALSMFLVAIILIVISFGGGKVVEGEEGGLI